MDITFKNLGIKFSLSEGIRLYKKDEVLEKLNFNKLQKDNCLLVLGYDKLDWVLLVNYLADSDKNSYQDIIEEFINDNKECNLDVVEKDKFICEDGRSLDYLLFFNGQIYTIIVISLINNKIIYSITHSKSDTKKTSINFSLNIMKSLFKQ